MILEPLEKMKKEVESICERLLLSFRLRYAELVDLYPNELAMGLTEVERCNAFIDNDKELRTLSKAVQAARGLRSALDG